jgi:DNA-binding phage protein
LNEPDPALLLKAIGAVARSKGMAVLAGDENPSFITVVNVFDALGFRLSIGQKQAS